MNAVTTLCVLFAFCVISSSKDISPCKTDGQADYANFFLDKLCSKVPNNTADMKTLHACYSTFGLDIEAYRKNCPNGCAAADRKAAYSAECCIIGNLVGSGKTVQKKKEADEKCGLK